MGEFVNNGSRSVCLSSMTFVTPRDPNEKVGDFSISTGLLWRAGETFSVRIFFRLGCTVGRMGGAAGRLGATGLMILRGGT